MKFYNRKVNKNLELANKKLTKLSELGYEKGYEEKTIWYPIFRSKQFPVVTTKVRLNDLPKIPFSKLDSPLYIDGGDISNI